MTQKRCICLTRNPPLPLLDLPWVAFPTFSVIERPSAMALHWTNGWSGFLDRHPFPPFRFISTRVRVSEEWVKECRTCALSHSSEWMDASVCAACCLLLHWVTDLWKDTNQASSMGFPSWFCGKCVVQLLFCSLMKEILFICNSTLFCVTNLFWVILCLISLSNGNRKACTKHESTALCQQLSWDFSLGRKSQRQQW